jgi:hypothetical protein
MSSIGISIVAGPTKDAASTRKPGFLTILFEDLSLLCLPSFTPSSTYQQVIASSLISFNYQKTKKEYRRDWLLKKPKPKGKGSPGKTSLPPV